MAVPTHVVIIVQNLPVPLDRRVWLECQALTAAGYRVSVICPKGPGDAAFEHLDGVDIHRYKPAPEAKGLAGFVWEFVYSWARTAVKSVKVWRRAPFQILQACNPPDTYWLLARLWRLRKVTFVFDQHDLNPELYLSRFGEPTSKGGKLQLGGLRWLEQRTYRAAERVISTNESYRSIAIGRGHKRPEHVTVVRSGPDTRRMRPVYPPAEIRQGAEHVLAYLGIMGPQDGVDQVLLVMDELVHKRGRTGVRALLLGFGDCLEDLKKQCTALGLDPYVTFTGRVGPPQVADLLSAADVGLCPDLKTPLNDVSTMNKTMEYMAYALPAVSFDLVETRVSGGDTVQYVASGDIQAFTDEVEKLLDDPQRRVELGLAARARVSEFLDWRPQSEAYVSVFDALSGQHTDRVVDTSTTSTTTSPAGRVYVDLDDEDELRRFVAERTDKPV